MKKLLEEVYQLYQQPLSREDLDKLLKSRKNDCTYLEAQKKMEIGQNLKIIDVSGDNRFLSKFGIEEKTVYLA